MDNYLDNNASSPTAASVVEAMLPWLRERHGNPSSQHPRGRAAQAALECARDQVAELLGLSNTRRIVFTSGGTEGNRTVFEACATGSRRRILVSAVEHPSVLEGALALPPRGFTVETLPVDGEGRARIEDWIECIDDTVALVSTQWVNNETGVRTGDEALRRLGTAARAAGVSFHVDAVQAPGRVPIGLDDLPIDWLTISGHKFHGPQGIGALVVPENGTPAPLIRGGPQESSWRGGTENVPGIVGLGEASRQARLALEEDPEQLRVAALRDRLEAELLERIPGSRVAGRGAPRVANTVCLLTGDLEGEAVVARLAHGGLAASSGSACGSGRSEPSHVLLAQGFDRGEAASSLRLSLSRETREAQIDDAVEQVPRVVASLRALLPGEPGD